MWQFPNWHLCLHLVVISAKVLGIFVGFSVVVSDHRDIKRTRLRDVLAHPPPYKFRVCANVIKYIPRAEHPLDIIHLFCPACKFLYVSMRS